MFSSGGASGFFDVGNGTAEGRASWSQQLVAGTWYHYVGVYDGATVSAYLNGVQVGTAAFAGGAIAVGTGPAINIARNPTYAGDYFIGVIYDARIYEQALSAAEVLALYQATTPPPILTVVVTQVARTLDLPVTNGQTVATLQGVWSNGASFTGSYVISSQSSNYYAVSGSSVVVNDAAALNAIGSQTIVPFWVEAQQ